MPKEVIRDYTDDAMSVRVGWGRDSGTVQVTAERSVLADSNMTAEALTATASADPWASLDRDGVNQLIRVLRRARDAAFGADA